MLAWPFSSRRSRSRPTAHPQLEVLETRTACAVAVTTTPAALVAANPAGTAAIINTVSGAVSTRAALGALLGQTRALAGLSALPPGSFLNIGQGVNVPGGVLDGVRAAAGDLPFFDPTQVTFQLGLSSVPQLFNSTGRGLLGGYRAGGGGANYIFSDRTTPDFRGLDGAIGLATPGEADVALGDDSAAPLLPDEVMVR